MRQGDWACRPLCCRGHRGVHGVYRQLVCACVFFACFLFVTGFQFGSVGTRRPQAWILSPPSGPLALLKGRRGPSNKRQAGRGLQATGPREAEGGEEPLGGKEVSLKDLASNKWLAHQLHEYVQAKEKENRKRAYLLPRRKRIPLQNFHENTTVIGKVVSLLPFGCRVDVGCLDTLGLLHVRDMHFLPGALKAGQDYLRQCEASNKEETAEEAAANHVAVHAAARSSLASREVSDAATDGWISHVGDVLKVGDVLSLQIKAIDRTNRRMRLATAGPKAAQQEAPRKAVEAFWTGQEVEGLVLRATDFGLFLDIGAVEDAFLHANEIKKESSDKEVSDLYKRFQGSRHLSRLPASRASSARPQDEASFDVLQYRQGDKLKGLRVLQVDAVRGRIQLTTRSQEEVLRLQKWRRQSLGEKDEAQSKESELEKIAKIRTALKLLERHRKKFQFAGEKRRASEAQPQKASLGSWEKRYSRIFPGYSPEDIEEALSLLEAERRRKELLLMQEEERKARKRHPRFIRQSADDLSASEAWQLLRKEAPGVVSREVILEDAKKQAIRAGLTTAEIPVFGADGLPRMQQVPLKDLLPKEAAAELPGAAAAAHLSPPQLASSPAALPPSSACKEDAGGAAASGQPLVQADAAEASAVSAAAAEAFVEDLEISPEELQQELLAFEKKLANGQAIEDGAPWPAMGNPGYRADGGSKKSDRQKPTGLKAADLNAFFAKSEAALLASLRKGRGRRDRALAAAEEEEIRDLIQRDRALALKAVEATSSDDAEASSAQGDSSSGRDSSSSKAFLNALAAETRGKPDEGIGEVSQSEVLETIRERLQQDGELEEEVRRLGETPEALAKKVHSILRHVTMPSVSSSVLSLQNDLAALLSAELTGRPSGKQTLDLPLGRRRRKGLAASGRAGGPHAKTASDIDENEDENDYEEDEEEDEDEEDEEDEEGFVSPLFQLPDESPETDLQLPSRRKQQDAEGLEMPFNKNDKEEELEEEDVLKAFYPQKNITRRPRRTRKDSGRDKVSTLQRADAAAADGDRIRQQRARSDCGDTLVEGQTASFLRDALASGAKRDSAAQLGMLASQADTAADGSSTQEAGLSAFEKGQPQSSSDPLGGDPARISESAFAASKETSPHFSSDQRMTSKSFAAAVSRARRAAALAAGLGLRAGTGLRADTQKTSKGLAGAAAEAAAPHCMQSFSEPAEGPLVAPFASAEEASEETQSGDAVDSLLAKSKTRRKADVILLPHGKAAGNASGPQATSPRPVRSLKELRRLHRQQHAQTETRNQHLQAGRRSGQPSPKGENPTDSNHREILNSIRRMHERRGLLSRSG